MIEVKGLSKFFSESGVLSLDNIAMTIPDNSIIGLIGTNGAGKSTLLRILAGIYKQDSGTVAIDGCRVYENNKIKAKIAYISDDQYYQPGMTMKKMASIHASLRNGFSMQRFFDLSARYGLDVNRRLSGFSKGMRRQSDIAIALSCGAKYLFCDETFDGLDPITREMTKKILIEEMTNNGSTILMSSHNLREMEDLCDRIVLIDRGRLVLSADMEDVRGAMLKYQLVFENDWSNIPLDSLMPKSLVESGRMITFIAEGEQEEIERKIYALAKGYDNKIAYFEALPLSLEEIFIHKLRDSGLGSGVVL